MTATLLSWFENLATKIAVLRTLLAIQVDGENLRSGRDDAETSAFRGPYF